MYYWEDDDASIVSSNMEIQFRDEDFGALGFRKEFFEVTMTYKSDVIQANPLYYYLNGNYASQSAGGTGSLVADLTEWNSITFNHAGGIGCKTAQFKLDLPSAGRFWLNDFNITRRILPAYRN